MSVCIVGTDPIAATFATEIARRKIPVALCGLPAAAVEIMARHDCPFPDEPELPSLMTAALGDGHLRAGIELPTEVARARLTIVVAPMELDELGRLDYGWLDRTSAEVSGGLARGKVVLYDGTLGIGDTRNRFGPILERGSGLTMGEDFGLACSPERSRPGHVYLDLRLRPKLVGAIDERTRQAVMDFLNTWIENAVMGVESLEAAEYVPLVEAAARHVNAALAFEFAAVAQAHGVNLHAALASVDTQTAFPVCFPALLGNGAKVAAAASLLAGASAGVDAAGSSLLQLACRVHAGVPAQTVARLADVGGPLRDAQVLVLADEAELSSPSPGSALELLVAELRGRGAVPRLAAAPPASGREVVDLIVLVHPRLHFAALELETFSRCRLLVDGTGSLPPRRVEAAGIRYVAP